VVELTHVRFQVDRVTVIVVRFDVAIVLIRPLHFSRRRRDDVVTIEVALTVGYSTLSAT